VQIIDTHFLGSIEGGTGQESEEKQVSGRHPQTGEGKGRDQSEH
jgi:hypothetical protein